jgi:hypothetical protein
MKAFKVWLRPLGDACRVRVDGLENAKWLLKRLSEFLIFKTAKPFGESQGNSMCSFGVSYSPPLTSSKLQKLSPKLN